MNPSELKNLQVQQKNLVEQIEKLKQERCNLNFSIMNIDNEIQHVDTKLTCINYKIQQAIAEPHVTEHALLRYCERVLKIDLEGIKSKILNEHTVNAMRTLGNGHYLIDEGFRAVFKNMSIISVLENPKVKKGVKDDVQHESRQN